MTESTRNQIAQIIADIKALHPKIESLTCSMKSKLSTFQTTEAEEHSIEYWRTRVLCDSLIRVRIFVEKNLFYIETLGILSLCRYTFELVVWLKHIEKDERFALFYARKLLEQQEELYQKLANHLQREIDFYCSLAAEEKAAHTRILVAAATAPHSIDPQAVGQKIAEDIQAASDLVDEKLALKFAIYSDDVTRYGYDYQAHRIKTHALPQALDYADRNHKSLAKFNERWATTISDLRLKEWKWKARAVHVGMADEYDFVYSYTSRLLHATPASLTTNQKSLEDEEVRMFLRYVGTQFRWIIKHVETQFVVNDNTGSASQ